MPHIEQHLDFPYGEAGCLIGRVHASILRYKKGLIWRREVVMENWDVQLTIPGPDARYNMAQTMLDETQTERFIERLEEAQQLLRNTKRTGLGEICQCIDAESLVQPRIEVRVGLDGSQVLFGLFSNRRFLRVIYSSKDIGRIIRELKKALTKKPSVMAKLHQLEPRGPK